MAVIENRGEYQWRALIRKKRFPAYSRTFVRQRDAQAWATDLEAAIGRRDLPEVRRLTAAGEQLGGTIADLVTKYEKDVLPFRKGAHNERPRLQRIRVMLGKLNVQMLEPQDAAQWRDERMKEGTVRHDLNTLSKLLGHPTNLNDSGCSWN